MKFSASSFLLSIIHEEFSLDSYMNNQVTGKLLGSCSSVNNLLTSSEERKGDDSNRQVESSGCYTTRSRKPSPFGFSITPAGFDVLHLSVMLLGATLCKTILKLQMQNDDANNNHLRDGVPPISLLKDTTKLRGHLPNAYRVSAYWQEHHLHLPYLIHNVSLFQFYCYCFMVFDVASAAVVYKYFLRPVLLQLCLFLLVSHHILLVLACDSYWI